MIMFIHIFSQVNYTYFSSYVPKLKMEYEIMKIEFSLKREKKKIFIGRHTENFLLDVQNWLESLI